MTETSVITKARRLALCQVTSGAVGAVSPISHIAFGDGGVDVNGEPIIPMDTQSQLVNQIASYPIDSVEYPAQTTARYTVTIGPEAMVGIKISEAALVDEAGVLCAIKNMYVKHKDGDVSFTFAFDDEF